MLPRRPAQIGALITSGVSRTSVGVRVVGGSRVAGSDGGVGGRCSGYGKWCTGSPKTARCGVLVYWEGHMDARVQLFRSEAEAEAAVAVAHDNGYPKAHVVMLVQDDDFREDTWAVSLTANSSLWLHSDGWALPPSYERRSRVAQQHADGVPITEIARSEGITRGAVYARLRRHRMWVEGLEDPSRPPRVEAFTTRPWRRRLLRQ